MDFFPQTSTRANIKNKIKIQRNPLYTIKPISNHKVEIWTLLRFPPVSIHFLLPLPGSILTWALASTLGCCFLLHVASGFGEVIALIAADLLLVVV